MTITARALMLEAIALVAKAVVAERDALRAQIAAGPK